MGMNTILILIAGIVMSTIIGTQVAPSIVEGIKVKKVQTQTINNQEVIFEAIKRYTTIKQKAPEKIEDLIGAGYLETNVNNNGFGVEHIIDSEKYTIHVDEALGVATITTRIEDPTVQEAFLNSFTSMSKPICTGTIVDGVCDTNEFKTTFVIPNEVMHGNALLMTGIPIGSTPPDSDIYKYWYDTSSGKATLKLYDGTNWVEVNLGGSGDSNEDKTIEGFEQNVSENGWVKLPNGLIMQWGKFPENGYSASVSYNTITFPIEFQYNCFNVQVSSNLLFQGHAATGAIYVLDVTKKDFIIRRYPQHPTFWFAIGY